LLSFCHDVFFFIKVFRAPCKNPTLEGPNAFKIGASSNNKYPYNWLKTTIFSPGCAVLIYLSRSSKNVVFAEEGQLPDDDKGSDRP
jgi:hypothetical protein